MTEPPLWKRIGIHKLKYRTEAERSSSEKVVSQRQRSSNSHQPYQTGGIYPTRDSILVQTARLLSPPSRPLDLPLQNENEEHCLKSLLDQFREMDELEKSAASQVVERLDMDHTKSSRVEELGSPKMSLIAPKSQRSSDSEGGRRTMQKKQPVVVLFLKQLRGEISGIRDTVMREKGKFLEDMQLLMNKTAVLLNRPSETVPTQNKAPDIARSCAEAKNFSMVFETSREEYRPREETREQTQSEDWQRTQATLLEQQSQLRQTIEKLNTNTHLLQLELSNCKKQRESDRLFQEESHKNLMQLLTQSHTQTLKQSRQAYTKLLCQKDLVISSLSCQLTQKTSQLTQKTDLLLHLQKRQRDSQLEFASSLNQNFSTNSTYVKKYKDLYEKSETERVRLQTEVGDLKREIEVVNIQLEDARKEANKVFEEKMEMLKRVEELSCEVKGRVHQVKKTLMMDYRQRVGELEMESEGLRESLRDREKLIESMKWELESLQGSIQQLKEEVRVKDVLANSDDEQSQIITQQPNLLRHAESDPRQCLHTMRTQIPPLETFKATQSSVKEQRITYKEINSDRKMCTTYKGRINKRQKQTATIQKFVSPAKRPILGSTYNEKSPYMLKTYLMGPNKNREKLADYTTKSEQKGLVTLQARVELLRKMMQSDLQSSLRKAY